MAFDKHLKTNKAKARKPRTREPFTKEELQKHLEKFNVQCVYCGEGLTPCPHCGQCKLQWDHFDPDGVHGIRNLVPSCKPCNVRKNDKQFRDWYKTQPYYSPEREKIILKFARRGSYPKEIPLPYVPMPPPPKFPESSFMPPLNGRMKAAVRKEVRLKHMEATKKAMEVYEKAMKGE